MFAHCFTCSKDSKAAAFIARELAEAGYGVLRFDFSGLGGSGGDFANIDDLAGAADWLQRALQAHTTLDKALAGCSRENRT